MLAALIAPLALAPAQEPMTGYVMNQIEPIHEELIEIESGLGSAWMFSYPSDIRILPMIPVSWPGGRVRAIYSILGNLGVIESMPSRVGAWANVTAAANCGLDFDQNAIFSKVVTEGVRSRTLTSFGLHSLRSLVAFPANEHVPKGNQVLIAAMPYGGHVQVGRHSQPAVLGTASVLLVNPGLGQNWGGPTKWIGMTAAYTICGETRSARCTLTGYESNFTPVASGQLQDLRISDGKVLRFERTGPPPNAADAIDFQTDLKSPRLFLGGLTVTLRIRTPDSAPRRHSVRLWAWDKNSWGPVIGSIVDQGGAWVEGRFEVPHTPLPYVSLDRRVRVDVSSAPLGAAQAGPRSVEVDLLNVNAVW